MPVGDAELNARGQPRKRAQQRTKGEQHAITEQVRRMLVLGMTDGEIRRKVSEEQKMKRRSVIPYITLARKRNREFLGTSNDDNLADSLGYWTRKKQEAEQMLGAARKGISDAEAMLKDESDKDAPDAELFDALNNRIEGLRKTVYAQEQFSRDAQREIDKLKGTHAPIRVETRNQNANLNVGDMSPDQLTDMMRRIGMPADLSVAPLLESLPEKGTA